MVTATMYTFPYSLITEMLILSVEMVALQRSMLNDIIDYLYVQNCHVRTTCLRGIHSMFNKYNY